MRQAKLALYHHGRVLGATWPQLWNIEKKPFVINIQIIIRATNLTIRSIDLVWAERKQDLPKEEEERLLVQLRERKDAVVRLSFTLVHCSLPAECDKRTVKVDSSGRIFVKEKGEYLVKQRLLLE